MNYSIRRLDKTNLLEMRELNKLFGDVFEDHESYSKNPSSDAYLKSFIGNKDNIILVAMEKDRIVGGLVAYVLSKFETERKEVYLYDLAVAKPKQRTGIGRELMEELLDVARTIGAYVVFVQADEGDEAVKFYNSLNPDIAVKTHNFDYLV